MVYSYPLIALNLLSNMFSNLYLYFFLSRFLSLMIFSISVSKSNQSISSYLGELFLFITSLYSFCSFFLEIVSIISTQKTSFIKFNRTLSLKISLNSLPFSNLYKFVSNFFKSTSISFNSSLLIRTP